MYNIAMPSGVNTILERLKTANYSAYIVGGCVRDSLLGFQPHDWDICTDASPQAIMNCFHDQRVLKTGLKHGTVTILMCDGQYEVTTFRKDGLYSDSRHPDSVELVSDLKEDLSRRDFTINALAYNEDEGVIDCFDGISDINNGIIRCVGNPDDRFSEDALRMLRAMRFASTYNFKIENETACSIHKNKDALNCIAAERVRTELCKILCGSGVLQILLDFSDVISVIVPELEPCIGFEQNNRYHQYTVYDHIAHAVDNYKGNDISIKIALLLHDIGKPLRYTEDENGGHFHGHAVLSRDLAEKVLTRLRFDNKTKAEVLDLVLYHDSTIASTPKAIRRWLNKIGDQRLSQLIEVKIADIKAHAERTQASRIEHCLSLSEMMNDVLQEQQCFSMKDLAVSGKDILSLGVPEGKLVGVILRHILDEVINGEIKNDRDILMNELQLHLKNEQGRWIWSDQLGNGKS